MLWLSAIIEVTRNRNSNAPSDAFMTTSLLCCTKYSIQVQINFRPVISRLRPSHLLLLARLGRTLPLALLLPSPLVFAPLRVPTGRSSSGSSRLSRWNDDTVVPIFWSQVPAQHFCEVVARPWDALWRNQLLQEPRYHS
jgi:hypothetical protein